MPISNLFNVLIWLCLKLLISCYISVKNHNSTIFQLLHLYRFDMLPLDFFNEVNFIYHRSEKSSTEKSSVSAYDS